MEDIKDTDSAREELFQELRHERPWYKEKLERDAMKSNEQSIEDSLESHKQGAGQHPKQHEYADKQTVDEHTANEDTNYFINLSIMGTYLEIIGLATSSALPSLLFPYSPTILALAPTYIITTLIGALQAMEYDTPLRSVFVYTTVAFAVLSTFGVMPPGSIPPRLIIPLVAFSYLSFLPRIKARMAAQEARTLEGAIAAGRRKAAESWKALQMREPDEDWKPAENWEPGEEWKPGDNWEEARNWKPSDEESAEYAPAVVTREAAKYFDAVETWGQGETWDP